MGFNLNKIFCLRFAYNQNPRGAHPLRESFGLYILKECQLMLVSIAKFQAENCNFIELYRKLHRWNGLAGQKSIETAQEKIEITHDKHNIVILYIEKSTLARMIIPILLLHLALPNNHNIKRFDCSTHGKAGIRSKNCFLPDFFHSHITLKIASTRMRNNTVCFNSADESFSRFT